MALQLWHLFLDLCLVWSATRVVGECFVRVNLPRVLGDIVAGILLGPTCLGTTASNRLFPAEIQDVLSGLAHLGLMLYIYNTGLNFDINILKGRFNQVLAIGVTATLMPAILGFASAYILTSADWAGTKGVTLSYAFATAAGCSVSALPVAALILDQKKMSSTPAGIMCIAGAGLVTILQFILLGIAQASDPDSTDPVWTFPLKLGLLLALLLALHFKNLLLPIIPTFGPLWKAAIAGEKSALGDLCKLGITMGAILCGVATDRLGFSFILGPFVFAISMHPMPREVRSGLHPSVPFTTAYLLPTFFAQNGLSVNLSSLEASQVGGVILILAASFVGKMIIVPVGMILGLNWIESAIQAALLNCRGLLVLVVNLAAADQNLYGEAMVNSMVVMALVSTIATIPLVDKLMELKVKADVKQAKCPCEDGSHKIDSCTMIHPSEVNLEDAQPPDISVEEGCVQLSPLSHKTQTLSHDPSSSAI